MSDNKDKVDKISFRTSDMVCSEEIILEIKDHKIESLEFIGGCPGNLLGISKLVQGMDIDTVIQKLSGISCGGKPTSCPDQLAAALRMYKEKKKINCSRAEHTGNQFSCGERMEPPQVSGVRHIVSVFHR